MSSGYYEGSDVLGGSVAGGRPELRNELHLSLLAGIRCLHRAVPSEAPLEHETGWTLDNRPEKYSMALNDFFAALQSFAASIRAHLDPKLGYQGGSPAA